MASRPLLARRPLVGFVIAAAVGGMVALGDRYAGARGPGHLDASIDRRLQQHLGGHPRLLLDLVDLANPATTVLTCAALCLAFLLLHRWRLAFLVVVGPAVCTGLVDVVFKPLFDRRLAGGLSYPSGHTAAASALALVVIIAMIGPNRPSWPALYRFFVVLIAACGAAAVAAALIGGGYHYATDTVGGLLVAIATVLSVALLIDALAGSRSDEGYAPTHSRRPDAELLPTVKA
jgi:membrane-associated phospholipid phosphatase